LLLVAVAVDIIMPAAAVPEDILQMLDIQ